MRYTVHATELVSGTKMDVMRSFDQLADAIKCAVNFIAHQQAWTFGTPKASACVIDNFSGLIIA